MAKGSAAEPQSRARGKAQQGQPDGHVCQPLPGQSSRKGQGEWGVHRAPSSGAHQAPGPDSPMRDLRPEEPRPLPLPSGFQKLAKPPLGVSSALLSVTAVTRGPQRAAQSPPPDPSWHRAGPKAVILRPWGRLRAAAGENAHIPGLSPKTAAPIKTEHF